MLFLYAPHAHSQALDDIEKLVGKKKGAKTEYGKQSKCVRAEIAVFPRGSKENIKYTGTMGEIKKEHEKLQSRFEWLDNELKHSAVTGGGAADMANFEAVSNDEGLAVARNYQVRY